jgi:tRNA-splicing ligase RtcB
MKWQDEDSGRLPVMSWCTDVEPGAMKQAVNLANHPQVFHHVALMPDCHLGYGMPIGGVIACPDSVIPYAVGVDIGCGVCALPTGLRRQEIDARGIGEVFGQLRKLVPVGEGHAHRQRQQWSRFRDLPGWLDSRTRDLAYRNLGTLGGGNHFMEVQESDRGEIWLMIHSGSRNLGYRIAKHHHGIAVRLCGKSLDSIPDRDLAWLPAGCDEGRDYIRDMEFALAYAEENRGRIMARFTEALARVCPGAQFGERVNIHHNYASREEHFGRKVWVHRKGATSAASGEPGIVPGSMGTASCIVRGLGNPDSFASCSHGAGRVMGRKAASRNLSKTDCDRSMKGIVFGGWRKLGRKGGYDLSEAPAAYKDIDEVMDSQSDLAEVVLRLRPLGVVKG